MTRRVLLIDSYYPSLLKALDLQAVPAAETDYEDSLDELLQVGFGTGGSYWRAFRELGWQADIVVPNALALQAQWMREQGMRPPIPQGWQYGAHLSRLPVVRNHLHRVRHLHRVLLEQVRSARPDVVLVQDINLVPPGFARALKRYTSVLVGEIASPPPPKAFFREYDLIISALPSIVDSVRSWGLRAESVPLGFDEKWAVETSASSRPIDAVFVGSFSRLQPATAPLLRAVAARVPGLQIYGPAAPGVLAEAGLDRYYHGEAWGREMFEILGRSKLVVNRHGSIAGNYAVNMRMYEATGTGAALITENKKNLGELFAPGVEVIAYDTVEEAADLAAKLLAEPKQLDRVASAGQARTLSQHTYKQRVRRIVDLIGEGFGRIDR